MSFYLSHKRWGNIPRLQYITAPLQFVLNQYGATLLAYQLKTIHHGIKTLRCRLVVIKHAVSVALKQTLNVANYLADGGSQLVIFGRWNERHSLDETRQVASHRIRYLPYCGFELCLQVELSKSKCGSRQRSEFGFSADDAETIFNGFVCFTAPKVIN